MLAERKVLRCQQCDHRFRADSAPEIYYLTDVPVRCPSSFGQVDTRTGKQSFWHKKAKRRVTKKPKCCESTSFEEVENLTVNTDCQELRIQETLSNIEPGGVPRCLSVVVLDKSLINCAQPGDDVLLSGFVWRRWKGFKKEERPELELFVEANDLQRCTKSIMGGPTSDPTGSAEQFAHFWDMYCGGNEFEGRAQIVEAICPTLIGLEAAKLAFLLTLIGGCTPGNSRESSSEPDGTAEERAVRRRWSQFCENNNPVLDKPPVDAGENVAQNSENANTMVPGAQKQDGAGADDSGEAGRSQCHLLLIGEPGTGKSQLLKRVADLCDRTVRTTGMGCTAAGLTCAAVREGSEWMLEAGALVLADGGVCCIDEFSCIRKDNRASIHEAMEQQTVSVAKAGLVGRLNCRCSIIAATNTTYSPNRSSAAEQLDEVIHTSIALPLLSRFDVMVVFKDETDKDDVTAQFLLDEVVGKPNVEFSTTTKKEMTDSQTSINDDQSKKPWPTLALKSYISFVQEAFQPKLDAEAQATISAYYNQLRRVAAGGSAANVRLFESLIRFCQAHARLMFREEALLSDAVAVIWLFEAALGGCKVVSSPKGEEGGAARFGLLSSSLFGSANERPALIDINSAAAYATIEREVLKCLALHRNRASGLIEPISKRPCEKEQPMAGHRPSSALALPSRMDEPPHHYPKARGKLELQFGGVNRTQQRRGWGDFTGDISSPPCLSTWNEQTKRAKCEPLQACYSPDKLLLEETAVDHRFWTPEAAQRRPDSCGGTSGSNHSSLASCSTGVPTGHTQQFAGNFKPKMGFRAALSQKASKANSLC